MRAATVLVLALSLASGVAHALPLANEPPAAEFAWSPAQPGDGEAVTFRSYSTDADGFIVVHEWDFGDGVVAPVPSGVEVQHVYQDPGVYVVRLTVTDQFLGSGSIERTLVVRDAFERLGVGDAPMVDFSWSPSVLFAGTQAEFVSEATDPSGVVLLHEWEIPGRERDLVPIGTTVVEHAFPRRGAYEVTLTATDWTGDRASLTRVVQVENTPPVASIVVDPSPAYRGVDVLFAGSATDVDGDVIVGWTWDFDDGSFVDGQNATRAFSTLGTRSATLTVVDEAGASSSTVALVRVLNRPPVVVGSFEPRSPRVGELVTFHASGVDPDSQGPVTFTWSFSDGVELSGETVSRAFAEAGDRSVVLRGRDPEGGVSAPYVLAVRVDP